MVKVKRIPSVFAYRGFYWIFKGRNKNMIIYPMSVNDGNTLEFQYWNETNTRENFGKEPTFKEARKKVMEILNA